MQGATLGTGGLLGSLEGLPVPAGTDESCLQPRSSEMPVSPAWSRAGEALGGSIA